MTVHRCGLRDRGVLTVRTLADEGTAVSFSLSGDADLVDTFANGRYGPVDGDRCEFTVDPYGCRGFRLDGTEPTDERG